MGYDFNSFANTLGWGEKWVFNKLKGEIPKPLPDFIRDYDLHQGLFPKNATNYDFDEVKYKLTIYIPFIYEVFFKDSVIIRYSMRVSGFLLRGKLMGIEGMKTTCYGLELPQFQ